MPKTRSRLLGVVLIATIVVSVSAYAGLRFQYLNHVRQEAVAAEALERDGLLQPRIRFETQTNWRDRLYGFDSRRVPVELEMASANDEHLQRVSLLNSLRKLKLYDSSLATDTGLSNLDRLTGLEDLDFEITQHVTAQGLGVIGRLGGLKKLRLVVSEAMASTALRPLAALSNLEELELVFEGTVAQSGIQSLAGLNRLKVLTVLNPDDAGATAIGELRNLTQLTNVQLVNCGQITSAGMLSISSMRHLRSLSLTGYSADLAGFDAMPELVTLSLGQCDDQGMAHVVKQHRLQYLTVGDATGITDDGLIRLGQLQTLQQLRFEINGEFDTRGLAAICKLRNLDTLELGGDSITDDALRLFAALSQLRNLHLRACPTLTGDGFKHWRDLTRLRALRLTDCDAVTMQQIARLESLETLVVRPCKQFVDQDLVDIASVPRLRHLALYDAPHLTAQGVSALGGLATLETLDLGYFPVSDVTIDRFANLRGLRRLNLAVSRQEVSRPQYEALRAALPNCAIHYAQIGLRPPWQ